MSQQTLKVRIKKLDENAVLPTYAKKGDACLDLTAISLRRDDKDNFIYGTGLSIEVPEGYVCLLFPRSSNRKTFCYLTNHVGIIDSGFRGEIEVTYKSRDYNQVDMPYKVGERVAQIMIIPYPIVELIESNELSETERGTGGHGSTGN